MAKFKMLVGIPASGKSTYADALNREGWKVFSSDKLRERMHIKRSREVFSILEENIVASLKNGRDCVLDATNVKSIHRKKMMEKFTAVAESSSCDVFLIPTKVCMDRNRKRRNKHGVTDEVIIKMANRFEMPQISEGFQTIIVHRLPEADRNCFESADERMA